jgi:hypothetical protein
MQRIKIKIKELIPNLIILTITSVFIFISLDIIIMFTQPITTIYEYSPHTDYVLKPNKSVGFNTVEFNSKITTNSFGLRDSELNLSKEIKILVLGDSFTFGLGVNNSQTFSTILENQLNSELGDRFEVINTGVNGYDTKREYKYLVNYGNSFNPDYILLMFVINDPLSNSEEYWFSTVPTGMARFIPLKSVGALIEYSRNPWKLLNKLGYSVEYENDIDHFDCLRKDKCAEGWKSTLQYLRLINDFVDDTDKILIIVNVPVQDQLNPESLNRYNITKSPVPLKEYCKGQVKCIDLSESLSIEDYYDQNGHWKPSGHQKAAQEIFEIIM